MRLWSGLVSLQLAWILALVGGLKFPVQAEDTADKLIEKHLNGASDQSLSLSYQTLVQTPLVQITNVRLEETNTGLQVVLETLDGELSTPTTSVSGDALIVEIANVVLIGEDFEQFEPAEGIAFVQVSALSDDRIQVVITGSDAAPTADIGADVTGLTLSVVPGIAQIGETDEPLRIVVTGEEDEEYNPSSASTATRTETPLRDIPQSIQVVPRQVLEDRNAQSINQAVETVSGVADGGFKDGSSSGDRIIRGFRQAGNFRNGYRDAAGISVLSSPISVIERVEVLKGPASVLFGALEPGGVVNVVTRQPLDESFYELNFEAGNYDSYQVGADLTGPLTTDEDLLYRFIAAYQTEGSIQDFVDTDEVTFAPSLTWEIGERTNLDLYYEYTDYTGEPVISPSVLLSDGSLTPRNLYTFYPDLNTLNTSTHRFGYTLTHELSDSWQIRNNFAGLISDSREDEQFAPRVLNDRFSVIEIYDSEFGDDSFFVQADVVGEFETGPIEHQLVAGFDFNDFTNKFRSSADLDVPLLDLQDPNYSTPEITLEPLLDFQNDIQFYGVYLQDQISFGENFKFLIGGRYDWVSNLLSISDFGILGNTTEEPRRNESAFSPRLGLVYQPSDDIALFASYSRSFNQETEFDAGTDPLEPTRGAQYEIGVRADFLENRLFATLAAYHLTKTNVVTADPNNPLFSVQTGEQRSQGIELDVQGAILPGWNIVASYAYTDAEVTRDNSIPEGNLLPSVPENQASLWTTYTIQEGDLEGLGFGLGLFYVGDRQGDLANSFVLEDYFRTDAALYYRRDRFNAAINIRNLFDIDYVSAAESGVRTFLGRGEPFTIVGSISWKF